MKKSIALLVLFTFLSGALGVAQAANQISSDKRLNKPGSIEITYKKKKKVKKPVKKPVKKTSLGIFQQVA